MPSLIAGVAGDESSPDDDSALRQMAVPGMEVARRESGLLAQGDARLDRGRHGASWRLVDGSIEEASAEVFPDLVVLRRDPIGVRPLYYAISADRRQLAWASRPTQLLSLSWVERRPDWDGVIDVLAAAPSDHARTCWAGIRQVPPGHRLGWQPGTWPTPVREWDPAAFLWDGGPGPDRPAQEFAARLEEAVARRTTEHTTLLLSGGLDSSSIAAAAVRRGLRPATLSLSLPAWPSADETARILDLRAGLGLEGELLDARPDGIGCLEAELALHGEPHFVLNHPFLTAMYSVAVTRGAKVVLGGHFGDDVVGRMSGLGPLLVRRPGLAGSALEHLEAAGRPRRRTVAIWAYECSPRWARRTVGAMSPPRSCPSWLSPDVLRRHWDPPGPRQGWRRAQLAPTRPQTTMASVVSDRVACDAGVDLHQPFADRDLVEFALSLPPEAKHAGGRIKALTRDGFAELPRSVRESPRRTMLTEAAVAAHPMAAMTPLLCDPEVRVPGVDYDALRHRLESGAPYAGDELPIMRRLALIHRFLARKD